MILIPDNSTLRTFIPNSMVSVMGEKSLYDKIMPFLVSAENWFEQNFICHRLLENIVKDATDENDPLYFLPRRIVAMKAWKSAIPSLDVVIGPTGVGVTETNSLKPASKAKIENLMKSISEEIDSNIEALMQIIFRIPGWLDTQQADKFRISLFPDFGILDILNLHENRYEQWLSQTRRASLVERRLAREWISVPVLSRLRAQSLSREAAGNIKEVLELVRFAVVEELRTGIEQRETIEDVTNLIRSNKTDFAEWQTSDTAARFSAPYFKNKKENKGYWL